MKRKFVAEWLAQQGSAGEIHVRFRGERLAIGLLI